MPTATLLVTCPDQKGIVARLADFISSREGNILHADQHCDADAGLFLTRIEWDLKDFTLAPEAIGPQFEPIAVELGAKWKLHLSGQRRRMAIWVTRQDHCLLDLLWRQGAGELAAEIPFVLSNHPDLRPVAERHGIDFYHFPVTKQNKARQEAKELELLEKHKIDLIVLAKYMQILSEDFVARFPEIINIHHSFLPAFAGAHPYRRAHERGVKIIGATAHYVTGDLDEGPIIEQDVTRISHRDAVADLVRKGKDLERVVLARAVRHHLESRVLVYRNRTVVFA